eukprot:168131_1
MLFFIYHLYSVHNYPFQQTTVQLSTEGTIPNPITEQTEYEHLCEADPVFNFFQNSSNNWLCCDCVDSMIVAVEHVSKYVDTLRIKLYPTAVSTTEMKESEIPTILSNDTDSVFLYICPQYWLHKLKGKSINS